MFQHPLFAATVPAKDVSAVAAMMLSFNAFKSVSDIHTINHQPSTINHQSSIINHQSSIINHQ